MGNRGSLEFTPRLAMTKDATIYGMSLFNAPPVARRRNSFSYLQWPELPGFSTRSGGPHLSARRSSFSAHEVIEKKAFGKIVLTT